MKDLGLFQQKLTELHLIGCTMCEDFPEFSHMRVLQILHLKKLYKLRILCRNIASIEFSALKELELCDLKSLERWVVKEGKGEELTFPVVEKICIEDCPKLTTLPEAPKIKVLKIKEDKAQLSLSLISSRYMSSLSVLELHVRDTETALAHQGLSIAEMNIIGCGFLFGSSPSRRIVGIWKWFGQLQALEIRRCSSVIYWPEDEFVSMVSLTKLKLVGCSKLTGRAQVNSVAIRARDELLPQLKELEIHGCHSLTELFVLPRSITHIYIDGCRSFEFTLLQK